MVVVTNRTSYVISVLHIIPLKELTPEIRDGALPAVKCILLDELAAASLPGMLLDIPV